jgi:hypothetical protein
MNISRRIRDSFFQIGICVEWRIQRSHCPCLYRINVLTWRHSTGLILHALHIATRNTHFVWLIHTYVHTCLYTVYIYRERSVARRPRNCISILSSGKSFLCSSNSPDPFWGAPPPRSWDLWAAFARVKRPDCGADHEVRNERNFTSIFPHMFIECTGTAYNLYICVIKSVTQNQSRVEQFGTFQLSVC